MATKKNAPTGKQTADQPTVTRITAADTKPKKEKSAKKVATPETVDAKAKGVGVLATPFIALGRYFKGAWYELRQVRWPNRRATWSLTVAVLAFTAGFTVLILLLDALFKYLFELIIG